MYNYHFNKRLLLQLLQQIISEGIRIYTEAEQKEFNKDSRIDMNEVKDRLMFPVILYLFNIVIYLSSASFAWKARLNKRMITYFSI